MCTLASSAVRALLISSKPHACNLPARQCIFPSKRHFQVFPRLSNHDEPTKGAESAWEHVNEEAITSPNTADIAQESDETVDSPDGSQTPLRPKDLSGYGSAARRAGRHIKKPKELPQLFLPAWFFEKNVFLREELSQTANSSKDFESEADSIGIHPPTIGKGSETAKRSTAVDVGPSRDELEAEKNSRFHRIRSHVRDYDINENILNEISSLVRIGLESALMSSPETWISSKTDLLLYHPKNGGSFFLDELVTHLAATHKADLIRLDPQDIADIGGGYIEERKETHVRSLSRLGYDAYPRVVTQASFEGAQDVEVALEEDEPGEEEEEGEGEGEEEDNDNRSPRRPTRYGSSSISSIPIFQVGGSLMDIFRSAITTNPTSLNGQKSSPYLKTFSQPTDTISDLKITSFIETTLNASEKKRETNRSVEKLKCPGMESTQTLQEAITDVITDSKEPTDTKPSTENLIVMIRDYMEINSTSAGGKLLDKLHEIVKSRRKDGQRVIIIGTSSSGDFMPGMSRAGIRKIQSEPENGPVRTVLTPCRTARSQDLTEDHNLRVALINLRNIQDMLRRLTSDFRTVDTLDVQDMPYQLSPASRVTDTCRVETLESELQKYNKTFTDLRRLVWPLNLVHHIATLALGSSTPLDAKVENSPISMHHVLGAFGLWLRGELARYDWMEDEKEERKKRIKSFDQPLSGFSQKPSAGWSPGGSENRMKKLRRTCNSHEKKLLNGVVDPETIRTTFADVRAPQATTDALKNLTSLSLIRPEAFTYGVLATDKIPGLLLYGPPGTGKSLLARATAKESGATVLEVSGADIYDMYVGEGEKNVKAIFSLAKKLSPCIVFIDEADAILGARGGSSNRTTHREMINQFLREWDGMGELSAFIMVATNRPFDLDEASLRRLPRRLLVDLPTEEDREAILKIHLKDEILDPEVSLAKLASQTPFYSGSDLKNVAVAAALSCVREEVENAASRSPQPSPPTTHESTPSPSPEVESTSPPPSSPPPDVHAHPEKRTLAPRHFTHALEEISASISDDMSSLTAIRKFDDKFGDRRGRRKKMGGYGFETVKEGERKLSDRARVRNRN